MAGKFSFPSRDIKANEYLAITPKGRDLLDKEEISSMHEIEVLTALNEHSPETLAGISKHSDTNIFEFKEAVKHLKSKGLIQIVG